MKCKHTMPAPAGGASAPENRGTTGQLLSDKSQEYDPATGKDLEPGDNKEYVVFQHNSGMGEGY